MTLSNVFRALTFITESLRESYIGAVNAVTFEAFIVSERVGESIDIVLDTDNL